jgi:serine/threonine protein kinase
VRRAGFVFGVFLTFFFFKKKNRFSVFDGTWNGTRVALKLIDAIAEGADDAVREFENECKILSGFRHPNIIQL